MLAIGITVTMAPIATIELAKASFAAALPRWNPLIAAVRVMYTKKNIANRASLPFIAVASTTRYEARSDPKKIARSIVRSRFDAFQGLVGKTVAVIVLIVRFA